MVVSQITCIILAFSLRFSSTYIFITSGKCPIQSMLFLFASKFLWFAILRVILFERFEMLLMLGVLNVHAKKNKTILKNVVMLSGGCAEHNRFCLLFFVELRKLFSLVSLYSNDTTKITSLIIFNLNLIALK